MTDRHEYVELLKRKLDEWDHDVATLETRVRDTGNEVQARSREALADLRETRRQLGHRVSELTATTDEAWQRVRLSLDSAWENVKTGLAAARDELVPPAKKDGQQ